MISNLSTFLNLLLARAAAESSFAKAEARTDTEDHSGGTKKSGSPVGIENPRTSDAAKNPNLQIEPKAFNDSPLAFLMGVDAAFSSVEAYFRDSYHNPLHVANAKAYLVAGRSAEAAATLAMLEPKNAARVLDEMQNYQVLDLLNQVGPDAVAHLWLQLPLSVREAYVRNGASDPRSSERLNELARAARRYGPDVGESVAGVAYDLLVSPKRDGLVHPGRLGKGMVLAVADGTALGRAMGLGNSDEWNSVAIRDLMRAMGDLTFEGEVSGRLAEFINKTPIIKNAVGKRAFDIADRLREDVDGRANPTITAAQNGALVAAVIRSNPQVFKARIKMTEQTFAQAALETEINWSQVLAEGGNIFDHIHASHEKTQELIKSGVFPDPGAAARQMNYAIQEEAILATAKSLENAAFVLTEFEKNPELYARQVLTTIERNFDLARRLKDFPQQGAILAGLVQRREALSKTIFSPRLDDLEFPSERDSNPTNPIVSQVPLLRPARFYFPEARTLDELIEKNRVAVDEGEMRIKALIASSQEGEFSILPCLLAALATAEGRRAVQGGQEEIQAYLASTLIQFKENLEDRLEWLGAQTTYSGQIPSLLNAGISGLMEEVNKANAAANLFDGLGDGVAVSSAAMLAGAAGVGAFFTGVISLGGNVAHGQYSLGQIDNKALRLIPRTPIDAGLGYKTYDYRRELSDARTNTAMGYVLESASIFLGLTALKAGNRLYSPDDPHPPQHHHYFTMDGAEGRMPLGMAALQGQAWTPEIRAMIDKIVVVSDKLVARGLRPDLTNIAKIMPEFESAIRLDRWLRSHGLSLATINRIARYNGTHFSVQKAVEFIRRPRTSPPTDAEIAANFGITTDQYYQALRVNHISHVELLRSAGLTIVETLDEIGEAILSLETLTEGQKLTLTAYRKFIEGEAKAKPPLSAFSDAVRRSEHAASELEVLELLIRAYAEDETVDFSVRVDRNSAGHHASYFEGLYGKRNAELPISEWMRVLDKAEPEMMEMLDTRKTDAGNYLIVRARLLKEAGKPVNAKNMAKPVFKGAEVSPSNLIVIDRYKSLMNGSPQPSLATAAKMIGCSSDRLIRLLKDALDNGNDLPVRVYRDPLIEKEFKINLSEAHPFSRIDEIAKRVAPRVTDSPRERQRYSRAGYASPNNLSWISADLHRFYTEALIEMP